MLYGAHTGISSLAILVAAVFWTLLWGPVGLVLSTPLTVCLVVLGRYVPQLEFLHILLGDEPVLTPDAQFYQRLLAGRSSGARQVLEQHLEGSSLLELYDSVVIPALGLAEQDRHQNDLDEAVERFICQSTRELIEDLDEKCAEVREIPVGQGQMALTREFGPGSRMCQLSSEYGTSVRWKNSHPASPSTVTGKVLRPFEQPARKSGVILTR